MVIFTGLVISASRRFYIAGCNIVWLHEYRLEDGGINGMNEEGEWMREGMKNERTNKGMKQRMNEWMKK